MFYLNNHLLLLFYYLTYPPTHYLLPTTHNIHHTTSLFLSIFLIFQNNTFSSSWPNFLLSNSNTVFGWGENKKDGKYRVENISVFHCLAKEEKWGGRKTQEKVFSPEPTIFILPNREENAEEKSAFTTLLHKYLILESSKREKERERALEKRERKNESCAYAGTFLNEGEKENKRWEG